MPIAVPPNRAGIPAPTAPANPPTDQDVFNAKDYARRVYHAYDSRAQNSPTIAELSLVEQYTLSVVSARAGEAAAPPWFGPALREALAPIQADIRGIKDNVEALQQNVEALQQDVANINAQQRQLGDGVAIAYNATCGNGHERRFRPVRFLDGSDPVADHALPLLKNTTVISNLSAVQTTRYYQGYIAEEDRNLLLTPDVKRQHIALAIGCLTSLV